MKFRTKRKKSGQYFPQWRVVPFFWRDFRIELANGVDFESHTVKFETVAAAKGWIKYCDKNQKRLKK